MELLVAYEGDPAGLNMARALSNKMKRDGKILRGEHFDLAVIETPAISADWLEETYRYDGFVFLSKHASESGTLALTCHSTGNFAEARFGGNSREVAVPHPSLQKRYLQMLWERRSEFEGFEITIEATHHGPTALSKPTLFIEVGTGEEQWNDMALCRAVAGVVHNAVSAGTAQDHTVAIGFGGGHYSKKFTRILIDGEYALGTAIPRHALEVLDEELLSHVLERNRDATVALIDEKGLGKSKRRILRMLTETDLEVIEV